MTDSVVATYTPSFCFNLAVVSSRFTHTTSVYTVFAIELFYNKSYIRGDSGCLEVS